jgi:streptogramin lyase
MKTLRAFFTACVACVSPLRPGARRPRAALFFWLAAGALAVTGVARAQQTVVANYSGSNLVILNLATGDRSVLSSSTVGTGTNFSAPVGLTRESNGSILLGENSANARIFRVDATTGNRTILSGGASPSTVGTGSAMSNIYGLAVEADGSVLAAAYGGAQIVRINPSTGDRTIVTSSSVGSGATMRNPFGLLVDSDNSIVFTAYFSAAEVIRVNP